MRALPVFHSDPPRPRLPLCAATALELESALLAESDARRARLRAALAEDPALLLWTMCHAQERGRVLLPKLDAAARFLAGRLTRLLSPLADEGEAAELSADAARQSAELAARSVAAASAAARLAKQRPRLDADEAYLLGLTHAARRWWRVTGEDAAAEPDLAACLPRWHVELLDAIEETGAGQGLVACVREAVETVAHRPSPEDARRVEQVERRWTRDEPDAAWRLGQLARRLARLEDLETRFQQTLEREKLESLRQLAYGAGHEINNPLANISARAQTLVKEEPDPERRRRLAAINAQAFRAHEMIADLMLFARPPDLVREQVDLVPLVDRLIEELSPDAAGRGTTLRRVPTVPSLAAEVDPVQIAVALRAMCVNSLEALGGGGHVELTVRPAKSDEREDRPWVEIIVADDGPGIPPEARRHLFDPFFSGREAGRGLGFGLSKCWRIVAEHGGQIEVAAAERGATFAIRLPARRD
jgi:signal transduction histidine kinase